MVETAIQNQILYPPSVNLDEELIFKNQLKRLLSPKTLSFLLIPGKKDKKLDNLTFELNKYKTKRSMIRRLLAPLTITGFIILFVIISWGVFAPWISWYTFKDITSIHMDIPTFRPPNELHPLGTAEYGQDVFGRLIWGARASLTLGLTSIIISVVFGVIIGVICAFRGGWLDSIIMRISDIMLSFPTLILTILIVSLQFEGTIFENLEKIDLILLVWGILGIPGYARLMRSSTLQEKAKMYVESGKVSGASDLRLMFRHILPNAIAPIVISVTFDLGGILLGLASLSFLGFGSEMVEWGSDIALNKSKLISAPWSAIWPGVGILTTVLGFMLVGDGLRDAFDPRTKV